MGVLDDLMTELIDLDFPYFKDQILSYVHLLTYLLADGINDCMTQKFIDSFLPINELSANA
mgnify:CR=1 FL=1